MELFTAVLTVVFSGSCVFAASESFDSSRGQLVNSPVRVLNLRGDDSARGALASIERVGAPCISPRPGGRGAVLGPALRPQEHISTKISIVWREWRRILPTGDGTPILPDGTDGSGRSVTWGQVKGGAAGAGYGLADGASAGAVGGFAGGAFDTRRMSLGDGISAAADRGSEAGVAYASGVGTPGSARRRAAEDAGNIGGYIGGGAGQLDRRTGALTAAAVVGGMAATGVLESAIAAMQGPAPAPVPPVPPVPPVALPELALVVAPAPTTGILPPNAMGIGRVATAVMGGSVSVRHITGPVWGGAIGGLVGAAVGVGAGVYYGADEGGRTVQEYNDSLAERRGRLISDCDLIIQTFRSGGVRKRPNGSLKLSFYPHALREDGGSFNGKYKVTVNPVEGNGWVVEAIDNGTFHVEHGDVAEGSPHMSVTYPNTQLDYGSFLQHVFLLPYRAYRYKGRNEAWRQMESLR